jgi:5-formyltetrahydrofolate cyclo-ligase
MADKSFFRKNCIEQLKKIKAKDSYNIDKRIVLNLYRYIKKSKAQNILLYLPLKSEVNVYPLILQLRKEKKKIYVPFMESKSFRLVKYRLPLKQKQFGIKEPNYSIQYRNKKIDIAIVPMIGIDSTLRRVGFGKGMYDRFFEKQKYINRTVFVARKLCYSKKIITNNFDIKADMIITAK